MPLKLALAGKDTVAGHQQGALKGAGGGYLPPSAQDPCLTHEGAFAAYCQSSTSPLAPADLPGGQWWFPGLELRLFCGKRWEVTPLGERAANLFTLRHTTATATTTQIDSALISSAPTGDAFCGRGCFLCTFVLYSTIPWIPPFLFPRLADVPEL